MKQVAPLDQALRLLNDYQKSILLQTLDPLNLPAREDLCLAIVAYQRFGVPRIFPNPLMQVIYTSFIELL